MADRASILCVGNDIHLLRTRSAVLDQAGYSARTATLRQAEALMASKTIDLIVVSAELSADEKSGLLSAIGKPPILILTGLTLPTDLLSSVKRLLANPRH